MSAAYQDLYIEQGASFQTAINATDANGYPLDLTHYNAVSVLKNSYYASNATAVFTTTIYDPVNGGISLELDYQTTANVAPGRYVYDLIVINPTTTPNTVTRVMEGIATVAPGVTIL